MTKSEALHRFMSGFNIKAYPINAVPKDAELPYLTYTKGFSPEGYSATINIYFYTTSEAVPDAKAEEICESLRNGGVQIPCDNGQLWLGLETPEWYSASEEDQNIKHRVINISINDFTI